ncbi:hypothetical protein Hanom_Chr03g00249481 [Helianthus anomalus]
MFIGLAHLFCNTWITIYIMLLLNVLVLSCDLKLLYEINGNFYLCLVMVQCDWWLGSWYVTRPAVFPHVVFWGCDIN